MKIYTNETLQLTEDTVDEAILNEYHKQVSKFGKGFNSTHELYGVLLEEVEEFWESIKKNEPDPEELIQIAAVVRNGILWLAENTRTELKEKPF